MRNTVVKFEGTSVFLDDGIGIRKVRIGTSRQRRQLAATKSIKWTKESYKKYLNSLHWKKTRQVANDESRWKCSMCGSTESLDVHHKHYRSVFIERRQDLSTLCRACHGKVHGIS